MLAAYANLSRRINWAVGISQEPYYFFEPSQVIVDEPAPGQNTFVTNVRRLVVRSAFGQAYYPISRFQRIEGGMRFANVDDALLSDSGAVRPGHRHRHRRGPPRDRQPARRQLRPAVRWRWCSTTRSSDTPHRSTAGATGSSSPRPSGDWSFSQITADYRRYDRIIGPIVLATRLLYFGRIGPRCATVPASSPAAPS